MVDAGVCAHIERRGFAVSRVSRDDLGRRELHAALSGAAGYLIGGYELALDEHFEACSDLEAVAWIGNDYRPNVPGWRHGHELGIAFITSPGTNTTSVAEFTILLCLLMARPSLTTCGDPGSALQGRELRGRHMGILGLGRIGTRVAEMAKLGLGMEVSYFSRHRRPDTERSLGITYLPRQELIATSEVLSLHRTGPEPGERPDLRAPDLRSMLVGSLLINTVHHGLVDPFALFHAVQDGVVRAAFDGVGPGDSWSRLVAMGSGRFLAAPSIAFDTVEANHRGSMVAADALCDVLSGRFSLLVDNVDFRTVRQNRAGG